MSTIDERLRGLGIALLDVMPPVVDGYLPAFAPFIRCGDQIHLSGRLGKKDGKPLCGSGIRGDQMGERAVDREEFKMQEYQDAICRSRNHLSH